MDWILIENDHEESIQVWKRPHPDSGLLEFKGIGPVDASINHVLTLLTDPDRLTEWVDTSIVGDLLDINYDIESLGEDFELASIYHIQYMQFQLPFPFQNRDVIIKSVIEESYDKSNSLTGAVLKSHSIPWSKMPLKDGITRMPMLKNATDIRVTGRNRVMVEFKVIADPAGNIPSWLVNVTSRYLPFRTIQNIREMVATGEYNKKRKDFVNQYIKRNYQKPKL